jgi:hypothetical protein
MANFVMFSQDSFSIWRSKALVRSNMDDTTNKRIEKDGEVRVSVYLRLRPFNNYEYNTKCAVEQVDERTVSVNDPTVGDWKVDCDKVS